VQFSELPFMTISHLIAKVTNVTGPELYKISVQFDDGKTQTINLEPLLHGPLYGPLKDPEVFRKVYVDNEVSTIAWPNGADFDPATLYNWEAYAAELEKRALQWK